MPCVAIVRGLRPVPSAFVPKEILVERLWSAEYHPLIHDNPLWVNTRRLRSLLENSGLSVELAEDGYWLSVPDRFLFIDPSPGRHLETAAIR